MSRPGSDPIVDFYSGGPDPSGRTLEEILAWDDDRLEAVHDYIQWIFPTRAASGVNPLAPLITRDTIHAFETDRALSARLRQSLDRMLLFYGLRWREERVEIDERLFPIRARNWLHAGNHNHLRLTRMMDSLASLGLRAEALALGRCLLEDVCAGPGAGRISPRTIDYWRRAVA